MAKGKSKSKLRFAALIRVSTEQQEKTGESLRTQRAEIKRAVEQLGGVVVEWYGGQEHATPGFEKKEVDRLLQDAAKGKFDAVIVANADRWSRDNVKAQAGLDHLQAQKVRFFVSVTEYDLFNPEHVLFLGMSAVIGRFQAQHQNRKSMLNRIERAKRGFPTCGKLPYGRDFDRKTGTWSIDKSKQKLIQAVAKRYLAGESMPSLALEMGLNNSSLHKTLTKRCGTHWEIDFECADLNIKETVTIQIPALLDEKTIKAIQRRTAANKTYLHGKSKYQYLFSGMVFCGHCGYAMFGQTNHGKKRYYRHAHTRRVKHCPCDPRPWVVCDDLEEIVMQHLFECLGNPKALEQAMADAIPNADRIKELREQVAKLEAGVVKIEASRQRILKLIAHDRITEQQAEKQLDDLGARETKLKRECDQLNEGLSNLPTVEDIKTSAASVANVFKGRRLTSALRTARRSSIESNYDEMTWEQKRALALIVFGGVSMEGRPMGIYIESIPGQANRRKKQWRFKLIGNAAIDGTYLNSHSVTQSVLY